MRSNIAAVCAMCISAICYASAFQSLPEDETCPNSDSTYGVIVDCGSSGTRVNLFRWNSGLPYPKLLNFVEPIRDDNGDPITFKKRPGLSIVSTNPSKASEYMTEVLDFVEKHIPKCHQPETGIYMMGTAGLRLLDKPVQKKIMEDLKESLESNYNFAKIETSVITGTEEGMFQWISVNSKEKRFGSDRLTYGVIEMGGASLQVSYQIDKVEALILGNLKPDATLAWMEGIVTPKISRDSIRTLEKSEKYPEARRKALMREAKHNFTLFSTTFLGLGSNSARDNYVDMLININERLAFEWDTLSLSMVKGLFSMKRRSKGVREFEDPCLPAGSSERIYKPKSMLSELNHQTLGFKGNPGDETFTVRLTGTGKYDKCKRYIKKMLAIMKEERLYCEPNKPCSMSLLGTNFVPFDELEFLGIGDFYYSTSLILNMGGQYDHDKFVKRAREVCSTPWDKLDEQYGNEYSKFPDRVKLACFKAVFVDVFLVHGLNMPKSNKRLNTLAKLGELGDEPDWTLGAVLENSRKIRRARRAMKRKMM